MVISYPLRNPLWPKEKDNVPLKWDHHQPKTHTLPKNKMKALNQINKIKVKFSPPSKFKIKSKHKTTLKMIKLLLLNLLLRGNCSVVPPRLHPSSL